MVAGIDISKDKFDLKIEGGKTLVFDNNQSSFPGLKKALKGVTRVLMEATGTFYVLVAEFLHAEGFEVVVVNPAQAKFFCQYKIRRNKTDKVDASILCIMAKDEPEHLWTPNSKDVKELIGLLRVRDDLIRRRSAKKNQLKNPGITDFEKEFYARESVSMKDSIKLIDGKIRVLMNTSEELAGQSELLESIPGLGTLASAYILAHLPKQLTTAKQAAAYVGLTPMVVQSGKFEGKTRISKMGHSNLRRMLYLCSWSAAQTEGPLKEFYERMTLAKGSKKAALCAVAHKLIRIAHAVLQSQTKYDPNLLTAKT